MKISLKTLNQNTKNTIGGFSNTSKMPWLSWSISADLCITGSKLSKIQGTICYLCYAQKDSYTWPNTINAMERRLETWKNNPNWADDFIESLRELSDRVEDKKLLYFRWFDSGDIQSFKMLENIATIANALPHIQFWLPTKEFGIVSKYLKAYKVFPSNLTVRLSAYKVNQQILSENGIFGQLPNSMAVESKGHAQSAFYCPSSNQGNKCLDCRKCWDNDTKTIAYTIQ